MLGLNLFHTQHKKYASPILALILAVSLIASQFLPLVPTPAHAASFGVSWTPKSDSSSNCTGTGCVSTTISTTPNVDLSAEGSATLKTDSLSQYVTENFNGTNGTDYHLDEGKSWAAPAVTGYVASGNSAPSAPPTSGLIAHYSFDNSTISGTSVSDISGSGSTGSLAGSPTTGVAGPSGLAQAVTLDGSSYLTVPQPSNLPTGAHARTVSMWVKTTATNGTLFYYGEQNTNKALVLGILGNGHVFVSQWGGAFETGVAINDGAWHEIAVTFDGTTYALYQDGAYKNSGVMGTETTASDLYIGDAFGYSQSGTVGSIDDITMYDRALSGSEVNQLYTSNRNQRACPPRALSLTMHSIVPPSTAHQ